MARSVPWNGEASTVFQQACMPLERLVPQRTHDGPRATSDPVAPNCHHTFVGRLTIGLMVSSAIRLFVRRCRAPPGFFSHGRWGILFTHALPRSLRALGDQAFGRTTEARDAWKSVAANPKALAAGANTSSSLEVCTCSELGVSAPAAVRRNRAEATIQQQP